MSQVYNSQLDAFELYHKLQEAPERTSSILGGPALPALGHAIAGSTGAAFSNVCTYPLVLIITRLQIQRQLRKDAISPHSEEYRSIGDAVQKIHNNEGGIDGFYVGILSDTTKTIADSFLFFLAYNFLRQSRIQSSKPSSKYLPVIDELSVGFLAGAFSKLLTTPIANIVTRKQTASMMKSRDPEKNTTQSSIRSIAEAIHYEKGLRGFWSGYSASLVLTLNPSLTFFFYEALKRSLLPHSKRADPPPQATFLLAAMSKAMASTITYPFSLSKSRLQSSTSRGRDQDRSAVKLHVQIPQRAPSNVFAVILQIARTEGFGALYEGLGGEVLKGFFSHGITMIVKEAAHKLVIHLYYTLLKLLRRYPNPQELVAVAKEQAGQTALDAAGKTRGAANSAKIQADQLTKDTSKRTQQAAEAAREGVYSLTEKGQELVDLTHDYFNGNNET